MDAIQKMIKFMEVNPETQKCGIETNVYSTNLSFAAYFKLANQKYIFGYGATEDDAADEAITKAEIEITKLKGTPPEPHTTITVEDIAAWHGHNSSEYVATLQEILTGKYALDDVRKDILDYRGE